MFHAARGKYMELVLGRRAAEDDEHTEVRNPQIATHHIYLLNTISNSSQTDGSDPDAEEPHYLFRIGKAGTREVERGFFAEAVREPDGAAAYDRGRRTWDDFVQKVRLGEDLNPQMQALDSITDPTVQDHVTRTLTNLLQAAQVVAEGGGLDGVADWPPKALSMLADTALSEPIPPHLPRMDPNMSPASRHLIPTSGVPPPPTLGHGHTHGPGPGQGQGQGQGQGHPHGHPHTHTHGPTDPRSFILPRPTPTQQPRRILPARGQLGLPDPFSMNGPPQLPPPPGSNFQRLPPLPNYFPGPGPAPGPAPGPGGPGGPGQGPGPGPGPGQGPGQPPGPGMYFPSPHHSPHGAPPPQPPRRY